MGEEEWTEENRKYRDLGRQLLAEGFDEVWCEEYAREREAHIAALRQVAALKAENAALLESLHNAKDLQEVTELPTYKAMRDELACIRDKVSLLRAAVLQMLEDAALVQRMVESVWKEVSDVCA